MTLVAEILNQHSDWTQRSRVLVKTIGNQVMGILSDSYRRLNSVEILTAFVQEATLCCHIAGKVLEERPLEFEEVSLDSVISHDL